MPLNFAIELKRTFLPRLCSKSTKQMNLLYVSGEQQISIPQSLGPFFNATQMLPTRFHTSLRPVKSDFFIPISPEKSWTKHFKDQVLKKPITTILYIYIYSQECDSNPEIPPHEGARVLPRFGFHSIDAIPHGRQHER